MDDSSARTKFERYVVQPRAPGSLRSLPFLVPVFEDDHTFPRKGIMRHRQAIFHVIYRLELRRGSGRQNLCMDDSVFCELACLWVALRPMI